MICEGVILTCLLLFGFTGIWRFGLGSLSDHFGAGLGLGFRMDAWSRSTGTVYPGEDPDLWPCPLLQAGDKIENNINWLFNMAIFDRNQRHDHMQWWGCTFSDFCFSLKRRGKLGSIQKGGIYTHEEWCFVGNLHKWIGGRQDLWMVLLLY